MMVYLDKIPEYRPSLKDNCYAKFYTLRGVFLYVSKFVIENIINAITPTCTIIRCIYTSLLFN